MDCMVFRACPVTFYDPLNLYHEFRITLYCTIYIFFSNTIDYISLYLHFQVDLRTRKSVFQYPNHHSLYKKLTFNLDESSDILCAPGEDNITRLWSVKEGKLLHSLPLPNRDHCGQINTYFEADGRKMYVHILLGETIHTFEALEESVEELKVLRISAQPLF